MDRRTLLLLSALLLSLPLAAQAAEESPPAPAVKNAYKVGAGDVLRVVVWKNADLTGDYLVRPDGILTMPLIGDILAGGMATDGIALQVERKLKYFIEAPLVSVIVTQANSSQIYVLGQVTRPAAYPLPAPITLLQAIAAAGGFTPFADRNGIILIRQDGEKQTRTRFRFDDLVSGAEKSAAIQLTRGDTLIVP